MHKIKIACDPLPQGFTAQKFGNTAGTRNSEW